MPDHPRYGHPARSIRVPDDLWNAATEAAARHNTNLSEVVRAALERFVREDEAPAAATERVRA